MIYFLNHLLLSSSVYTSIHDPYHLSIPSSSKSDLHHPPVSAPKLDHHLYSLGKAPKEAAV